MALAVLCLFALNVYHSYSLGQYRTMYDNPIYRWRVSLAVALSELRDPPLSGYVAYGSIVKYLNEHGLALMDGEASPMPSYQSVVALAYDTARLNKLLKGASTIPIDHSLPSVPIVGSEKGEAAFYYWAFRLFGIQIVSLWLFYFSLLGASTLMFFITFWRSPVWILLLMLYLCGHIYMLDIATISAYQTVHNSRFLPVLAVLPSMHLLLLVLGRPPPSLASTLPAIGQTLLLFFVLFCRIEAGWQIVTLLMASAIVASPTNFLRAPWRFRITTSRLSSALFSCWPTALIIAGALGFVTYERVALDYKAYSTETRTHTFWDPLVVGTISANSALTKIYGMGQPAYSDTMGYYIARQYLVEHNDTTSPIAIVQNGRVVGARPMDNMGAYDTILREVFFQIAERHPWLTLQSFVYDKPRVELSILMNRSDLYRLKTLIWVLLLSAASASMIFTFDVPVVERNLLLTASWVLPLAVFLSMSTIFIYPTTAIPDAILLFLLLILMGTASITALVWAAWKRTRPDLVRWRCLVRSQQPHDGE